MIPDQYEDHLNLYVQADSEAAGEALLESYTQKIQNYANERE